MRGIIVRRVRLDSGLRGDLIAFACALGVIAATVAVGHLLNRAGVPLFAATAPLFGLWWPRVGIGTPLAVLSAVLVILCRPVLPWRWLLTAAYVAAVLWTSSLAMIDGWHNGIAGRLTDWTEYLHDVPRVTDISAMLAIFTDHILAGHPGSWTVHVSAHPPGALLFYVVLDRMGLGGGAWAGVASILIGAVAAVAVSVTVRVVAGLEAARAVVPFAVLFPGAVWMGVSADAAFTGVTSAGVALLAMGLGRSGLMADAAAVSGGVLLGFGLFLNYGLTLMALVVFAVLLGVPPTRRCRAGLLGVAGAVVVVAAFAAAGFWWLDGYQLVVQRYHQGAYALRPYSYWVWGNLGALLLSAGPLAAVALRRAVTGNADGMMYELPAAQGTSSTYRSVLVPSKVRRWRGAAGLVLAATAAVVAADVSGLSKAEVERIWLPFAVWFTAGAALLPARHRRWWLVAQAATALAVNHLIVTNW